MVFDGFKPEDSKDVLPDALEELRRRAAAQAERYEARLEKQKEIIDRRVLAETSLRETINERNRLASQLKAMIERVNELEKSRE